MILAIVPAWNEEKSIGTVVRGLLASVDRVVVVDDCSADNTVACAQSAGAEVLCHELNRGQGAALETGHEYARQCGADFVVHFDGDGQFDLADIKPALDFLQKEQADILFGSRFLDKRSELPWTKRKIILPLARWFNHLFTGVQLSDAHNGFRILNQRALEKIIITQDRMAHASEIPALARQHNLKCVEFPVKVVYHEYGQSGMAGFKIIRDLVVGRFVK